MTFGRGRPAVAPGDPSPGHPAAGVVLALAAIGEVEQEEDLRRSMLEAA